MDKRIGLFIGLTALFAMGSAHSASCPTEFVYSDINDATGHVFAVFKADGISWVDAADCADEVAIGGATGHLATITSSSENQWVIEQLLNKALLADTSLQSQVWVGGYQDTQDPDFSEPSGGWRWVNNEGPFSGSNGNADYTNWASDEGEPNNNGGSENHLTIGRYSTNRYGWNDEGSAPDSIGGFIVEYDVPRAAACTVGVNCETIEGQTLVFPTGSFQTGETIKFTAYEYTDPRVVDGKCTTREGLTLFTDAAFGPDAQLRIPPYLCGSPKFVVVAVDSSQLDILKGTVAVEHETTEEILPGNLYNCFAPILGSPKEFTDPLYSKDPQYQDVVVWQSTNPAKMLENATTLPSYTGNADYIGAATEATNGCGSTVAKVRGASYFVAGMHIDFGPGFEYGINPAQDAQNYQQFVALTRYKLTLLRKSIVAARSAGSLRPAVSTAMDALIALAIYRLDRGNPAGALNQVRQFLSLVNVANYTAIPDQNYNGDHLMRGENIAFMLRVKVIPYKPAP